MCVDSLSNWCWLLSLKQLIKLADIVQPLRHVPYSLRSKLNRHRSLEESLSITTGRCDLAIAIHARKMHKNINMIVNWSILVSHCPKPPGGQPQRDF
jgi:hypothetical protein